MELTAAQVHRTFCNYIDVSNIHIMTQIEKVFRQHNPHHSHYLLFSRPLLPLQYCFGYTPPNRLSCALHICAFPFLKYYGTDSRSS